MRKLALEALEQTLVHGDLRVGGIRARKLTPAKAMAVMEPQDMRTGFQWFDGK